MMDEFQQMTQELKKEKDNRESVRDAYGDLRIKSMQQSAMNTNLMKAKVGSNAETPAPRKVIMFDNPYKELGTENSMISRDLRTATIENVKSHHVREHPMYNRKMSFFADS